MTAHGFGGAGIANAADAMSGVDNPANLTSTADQMSVGLSLFSPKRAANFGGGYVESDSNLFFIPQFAWTTTASPEVSWGILVNAMGGMNTDYPADPALFGTKAGMDLQGIIVSPTIGYKQSSDTSFGASLMLGYESLETTGPGGGTLPQNDKDSATGYGVKLGVTTKAMEGVVIGFAYQTSISMAEMSKHCDYLFLPLKQGGKDCNMDLPPMFGLGVNYALTPDSKIVADIQRVSWTSVDVFGASQTEGGFGWEDQTIIKVGYEQRVNAGYAWRIGFNYGKSPIPDDHVARNVLAPAVSESHITFGFTKKQGDGELVGYYAYVPEVEQTQDGAPNDGTKIKMSQHALGVGYNWK
jgi:long-chain fatty acid transport protein